MKKSLSAVLVIAVSLFLSRELASKLEIKLSKVEIKTEDGSQPGDNGRVKNGGKLTPGKIS